MLQGTTKTKIEDHASKTTDTVAVAAAETIETLEIAETEEVADHAMQTVITVTVMIRAIEKDIQRTVAIKAKTVTVDHVKHKIEIAGHVKDKIAIEALAKAKIEIVGHAKARDKDKDAETTAVADSVIISEAEETPETSEAAVVAEAILAVVPNNVSLNAVQKDLQKSKTYSKKVRKF